MTSQQVPTHSSIGLRWFDSLQFKLGLMFFVLLGLLGAVAFHASDRLVGGGLDKASFLYESEVSRRLAAQIEAITSEAENLANVIALIGHDGRLPRPVQKSAIESAAADLAGDSAIVGFGYWPEPVSTAPGAARDSLVWLRDGSGHWSQRVDYNNPDTIPWWREAWYTPARLVTGPHCYWSARYRDLLTQREVISCVLPVQGARGFEGAVTVSVALDGLASLFAQRTAQDSGYALLIDRDGQLLAMSKRAQDRLGSSLSPGRNIAELAQKQPSLNPLVLAAHARNETFFADALHSSLYDARQVSQLKDNTRELSRNEADSILGAVWNHAANRRPAAPQTLLLTTDPVLDETGYAVLASLANTDWQLASITPTREGQDSARYVITQTLVVTLGAVALTLLLAFMVLRASIIRPLRRMLHRITDARDSGHADGLSLEESARNELGAVAHWFNEQNAQIRDLGESRQSMSSQLAVEVSERLRAQEALIHVQERSHLALSTIDDGVITLDERGAIEDMNGSAEQLLGVNLRSVRGTPFAQSFEVRIGGVVGPALPNPAEQALERGSRIEYPDGVFLTGTDHAEREIYLAVAPLHARNGRAMGCVIVMRRLAARLAEPVMRAEPIHPVTGLGGRNACERRLRQLIDSARSHGGQHALLKIDIRLPDARAHTADADAVQLRIVDLLGAEAGGSDQVFSLASGRFGITLEAADTATGVERARQLIRRIGQLGTVHEDEAGPLASIGVVIIEAALANGMEGLRRAGAACDAAVRAGGGHAVLYDVSLDQAETASDDSLWVQRIRRGLDLNQFHLTTQWLSPSRARSADGQAFDMMAALEDEEGFWASSDAFLPVAERHLMAGDIDHWIVVRALDTLTASSVLRERITFCMLELSATTLADPSFFNFVAEQIDRHPLVAINKLCLVLRADLVTAGPQQAQRFCEALHHLGCRIALDLQTGRHTVGLELLRRLPLDFLKIDARQFRNIASDELEQTAAESTQRLASAMSLGLIVNGIENEAQATTWRRIGADYLQGPAIAKLTPVPFTAPF